MRKTEDTETIKSKYYVDALYARIANELSPSEVNEVLECIRVLPIIRTKALFVFNKKGTLVWIHGKKNSSKYVGVTYQNEIIRFDGNRLGKRKLKEARAYYLWHAGSGSYKEPYFDNCKIWKKIEKQHK